MVLGFKPDNLDISVYSGTFIKKTLIKLPILVFLP